MGKLKFFRELTGQPFNDRLIRYGNAEMTELADVQDLGSCVARREGSSPFFRIKRTCLRHLYKAGFLHVIL